MEKCITRWGIKWERQSISFGNFFSITRLIYYNNFVPVVPFASLAIFCLATEHFSNVWYVYFWIWHRFFFFSIFLFLSFFFEMVEIFVFVMENHEKRLPRKNQDFLICWFRVIIFYQRFESIQNHVVFYLCWNFFSNFARYFQTFLNQKWKTKIRRCECCNFAPRSNINFVTWDTSLNKCPTVRKNNRRSMSII